MKIDKKILKEFLRLKWNETKKPIAIMFVVIPLAILLVWFSVKNQLFFYIFCGVFYGVIFCCFIYMIIEWLKSNWKQATLNVSRRKTK